MYQKLLLGLKVPLTFPRQEREREKGSKEEKPPEEEKEANLVAHP